MSKTFLFQAIQFIRYYHSWQSGPESDGNEGVLRIPQSSSTAGTSPSDYLLSYPGYSLGGGLTPLQRSSQSILQPQLTGQPSVIKLIRKYFQFLNKQYRFCLNILFLQLLRKKNDNKLIQVEREIYWEIKATL